jgi:predicted Zn-dependent protease
VPDADPKATDTPWRWPVKSLQWPERTRHGQRVIHLPGGGSLQAVDAAGFDRWRQRLGDAVAPESWVVRVQQNWRGTAVALLLLVALAAAGYLWGVPALARGVVAAIPAKVDAALGEAAYNNLKTQLLKPSRLPPEHLAALQGQFKTLVERAVPANERPPWRVVFHSARETIGPNALALPGGTIIVTDELVKMLDGHDDALLGVMAHEFGHVQRRHGMHALTRFALLSTATSVALGDFSSVLAGAPALIGQLGYSRDAEREADADAARLLLATGRDPAVMKVLFERLALRRDSAGPPVAFTSHPVDEERQRYFEEASRRRALPAAR